MSMPSATVCLTIPPVLGALCFAAACLQASAARLSCYSTLHTGKKLESLRDKLQDTSPPLDSNGQLQPQGVDAALESMRAALDWDGRMGLSKTPKEPGVNAPPIDHMRWELFTKPGKTLQTVANGMHSPRHTWPAHGIAY